MSSPFNFISNPNRPCFGRVAALEEVFGRLQENHISVIAPSLYGKTKLLQEVRRLASRHGLEPCLLWDLRHQTPASDEAFYRSFALELERQFRLPGHDLSEWFTGMGTTCEAIKAVFQELASKSLRPLVLLDGLDSLLQSGNLTKNVWDNLRSLAESTSLRYLTASRAPLRELCACPESRTSDFWTIFHPLPIRLGAFQKADWDALFEPFAAGNILATQAGRAELEVCTGGVPTLTLALCDSLYRHQPPHASLDKTAVLGAARLLATTHRPYIEDLWQDIPTESRLDLFQLSRAGQCGDSALPRDRADFLVVRGLAARTDNGLKPSCRLLHDYAQASGHALPDIKRIFSTPADFERNIPEVLQIRLAHLQGFAPDAAKHVVNILKSADDPETAKELIRGLSDRCLDVLLNHLFSEGRIEPAWVVDWRHNKKIEEKDTDLCACLVPRRRGQRMKFLSLLFAEDSQCNPPCSYSIFFLIQTVHYAGNFCQHAVEMQAPVPRNFIISTCFAAIELLHQIRQDFDASTKA